MDQGLAAVDDRQPLHERVQPALTNFDRSLREVDRDAVREIVKDPYILDLPASDAVRERDLSKALTDNLARFLRELGTGFLCGLN